MIEELFELAPPGMDEVVGMLTMIDALVRGEAAAETDGTGVARFDLVIVDSAPTGHTLRLLALPVQAQAWVRQLMAVVLKYKAVAAFEQLASELVWLSRGLTRLQALLTTPVMRLHRRHAAGAAAGARDHPADRMAAAASDPETRIDREWGHTARVRSLPAHRGA